MSFNSYFGVGDSSKKISSGSSFHSYFGVKEPQVDEPLPLERRFQQPNTAPLPSATTQQQPDNAPFQMRSSHAPSIPAPQVQQPSTWDQIKVGDIKGLTGGNLPGHQGFFDPLNDGGGQTLPFGLDNTGVGKFLKRSSFYNDPANEGKEKPQSPLPLLADLFGGVQQFSMGGKGGIAGALGQDVFNIGANVGKDIPGILKAGKSLPALKNAIGVTASEVGSQLPFQAPTLAKNMLGMGAGGAGLTAAESLSDSVRSTQTKTPFFGQGNIDLNNRPIVHNPDGSISTVFSMTFTEPDGSSVLVPGVRAGLDRQMTPDEALAWYQKTGEYLGKFKTDAEAEQYANTLHDDQATQYDKPSLSLKDLAISAGQNALMGGLFHLGGKALNGGIKDLIKPTGVPAEPFGPPRSSIPVTRPFQRGADLGPLKLSDTLTPEYKARQAELNGTFKDAPIGSVDAPLSTRTLQESIDQAQGIGKPTATDYNAIDIFGKPLNTFKKSTDTQNAIAEITAKMTKQANGITKTLRQSDSQTPIETTRSQIQKMGGIRPSKGDLFEEQQVIPSWIKNAKGRPLDEVADTLGMTSEELRSVISSEAFKPKDYVAETFKVLRSDPEYQANSKLLDTLKAQLPGKRTIDSIPKLKPRELTPKVEPLPIEQPQRVTLSGNLPVNDAPLPRPVRQLTPIERKSLQWDNRSGIPTSPAPIRPIPAEQTLADVVKGREGQGIAPNDGVNAPIGQPVNAVGEIPKVGDSVNAPAIDPANAKMPDASAHPIAEHIMSKLDDIEARVRANIAESKGRLNAGLPVDTMLNYSILGGVKIARGVVKYSVWANDMVNDLGSSVRPHLQEIWQESNKQHSLMVDGTFNHALPEPQSKIIIGKPKDSINFKDALKKFYVKAVNTQQPIYDVGKVSGSDVGKLASNTKSVSGIVDHNFLTAMVDKKGDVVGDSLKKTVEAIPKGQEKEFWTYMSQRHNIDRAREEFNTVPKTDKQGFIIKDKDGNPVMNKEVTKKPTPVQANYTPEMSAEAVKIAELAHPEYRAAGDGIVKWIDDLMTTWGVDTGIVDKEVYAGLRKTYKSYFPTQRDFSTLESSIPDGVASKFSDQRSPIRKATGSERDIKDPIENIMNLASKVIRTAKYNEVGQSLLDAVKSSPEKMKQYAEVIPVKDGMFANTDNVISVLVDGKPQYLQINDKMLLDSMNGLPKAIGHIPVLDTLTNGFKGLITNKNPLFAIRNIFRDVPTAYTYGSEANPIKFGTGLIGAGKDILTNSPRLQKYQAVGGGGANFFNSGDVTKSAAELMGKGGKIKKVLSSPIKAIEKFNNLTETAPRLAEFNRVLNKTGDTTKALFAANDVSVNFSRGGNITKAVDKGVPYLNAGVQGLDKFFRGFMSPKIALSTIVKSGVAITAPDLALYMVNKDNPNYQALDNRTKDNNFLIPKEDGTFIKIPKSRELGVLFGSLLERGLRAAEGQKDSFKGFGNTVKTSFAPTNPFDSNFVSPATLNLKTNKDFANRAIIPQAMLMDKRSPYLQYDDKTSSIAKAIGELSTNVVDGGISPKQLDYLIKSYSGVIGQFGLPLATPGGDVSKTLSTQFVADPSFSSQATTDFYDKLDKISAKAVDKNIIRKIPSKKLTPEEDIRNSMTGVSTALSRGTKLINTLQASSDPFKDDKIKVIKTKMLEITNKAVSAETPKLMQSVENSSKKLFLK